MTGYEALKHEQSCVTMASLFDQGEETKGPQLQMQNSVGLVIDASHKMHALASG